MTDAGVHRWLKGVLLLAVLLLPGVAWCYPEALVQRVTGPAFSGTHPLREGTYLSSGAGVTTGKEASVVLKFRDGQIAVVGPESVFRIDAYRYQEQQRTGMSFTSLLQGSLRFITGMLAHHTPQAFQVRTPVATMGVRGTDFRMVMRRALHVIVDEGAVDVTNALGRIFLTPGQVARVANIHSKPRVVPVKTLALSVARTLAELKAIPLPPSVPVAPLLIPGRVERPAPSAGGRAIAQPAPTPVIPLERGGVGMAGGSSAPAGSTRALPPPASARTAMGAPPPGERSAAPPSRGPMAFPLAQPPAQPLAQPVPASPAGDAAGRRQKGMEGPPPVRREVEGVRPAPGEALSAAPRVAVEPAPLRQPGQEGAAGPVGSLEEYLHSGGGGGENGEGDAAGSASPASGQPAAAGGLIPPVTGELAPRLVEPLPKIEPPKRTRRPPATRAPEVLETLPEFQLQ